MTNFIDDLEWRYTTKAYDPTKKISDEDFNFILKSLDLAPSSINSQPTRYFIASSQESINRIAESANAPAYEYNRAKISKASHVIVFTSKVDYTKDDITKLVKLEQDSNRLPFGSVDELSTRYAGVVEVKGKQPNGVPVWLSKQAYISLGVLISAAATLRIDSTIIGGIDFDILSDSLDLSSKGLAVDLVVSLGYRSPDDLNTPDKTKKSRLPMSERFFTL